jgi:dipeptidyl aminopeptidase/acylaminoacyl peptidase
VKVAVVFNRASKSVISLFGVPSREMNGKKAIARIAAALRGQLPSTLPTFFADQVNEPVLVIHGNEDSNPGTLTIQSEVLFEAVRGSGGTARLVLLPFEDHGYRAKESIEHVLWEQIRWFDRYVKDPE